MVARAEMSAASSPKAGGDSTPSNDLHPRYNPWAIALTVTMATFMEVLDTSIANVALPHIAGGLSASIDEATWILTSYLVSNAIVLPASAWASTVLGRKHFYMSCVALFTISSALCGLAPSLSALILFRIMQGAGGGGLQPSEQGILADTFPPARRGMAFAVYGMAVVLAPAIGPTLGGWITDNYNWRWIFYINVPVGVLSLFLTHRMIEDPPYLKEERRRAFSEGLRIDYVGLMLLVLTFGPFQVMLDKGEEDDWFQSHFIVALAAIAVVSLLVGIAWELYQKRPIVNLRLLGNRHFAISCILMLSFGCIIYGTTTLLPEFVQVMMGYTAELAGFMISPGGLVILVFMPLVGALLGRVDARSGDRLRVRYFSAVHLSHDWHRSADELRSRRDAPRLPVDWSRVSVRSPQHHRICRCAGRIKRSSLRAYQPDAQCWRQCRYLVAERGGHFEDANPSGHARPAHQFLRPGVP
jgi:DHA2 family multidrug resistance protein